MAIAQLSIDMVAKMATFERDLKRTVDLTQQQTNLMSGALGAVKTSIIGLGSAFTVGFLVDFVKRSIDSVDALNDIRDATGASIENISALEDIAARTGTTMDTVTTALVKFNGVLKDAKPDSQQAKAFEALNLDIAELKRLDPAEALLKVATAFTAFADDGNKARIMQELFGKSLKDVAPFLKDLADKGELVAKVTTAQAEEAEKFNRQLFEMQKNVQDLSREITGPLITALNKFMEKSIEVARYSKNPFDFAFNLGENMGRGGIAGTAGDTSDRTGSWGDIIGQNPRLLRQGAYDQPFLPDIGGDGGKTTKAKSEQISDDSRALASYVEGLQRVLDKNDQLTEQEKALSFLRSIGATGEVAQVRELTLAMAAQIDQEKAAVEVRAAKIAKVLAEGDAISKANGEYQALLSRLYAATPQFNLEAQRKDVLALTAEFEAGRISEALYLEAVTARLDLVADKTDKAKTFAEDMQYVFTNAFKGMEDSLTDFVTTGKLDFSSLADSIISDMVRIAIQQSITKPLTAAVMGLFADGGSFDGGVQKFAAGGTFTNQIVSSPTLFKFAKGTGMMGEAGPEAIMPLTRGANGKLGVQASGGGGSVVVNIIESPGNGGTQKRRSENGVDMLDIFVEKVKSSLAGDISRGAGSVPAAMSRTYGLNRVAGAY